ncbi:MAG TPA: nucleotide disphospho-sugar-binding domain-containing protein [Azospirillum sp.]|nr:nucleotide disphospho-sugar-binding domain-containing protein [Azospirillum sp.]
MARVLLAWELGDGFGHVTRLLPVARRLREAGHDCVFAVRSLENSHVVLAPEGFTFVQAPFAIPAVERGQEKAPMSTFGDILATVGFADVHRLLPMVTAWQGLIDVVDPALIVTDYAPGVCVAAYGVRPVVNIGDGFVLPPPELDRFPPFRDAPPRIDEAKILATLQEVQRRRGRPVPPTAPSILAGSGVFVITLPELDFYGKHRQQPAIGTLTQLPPPLEEEPEEDYFGYLSLSYPHTVKVLDGLAQSGRTGRIYLRDAAPQDIRAWRERGLAILDRPQPMREAVGRARVIVHHGGVGTVETVLALGRPQLVVPRHQEQRGNANALGSMRVAVSMRSGGQFEPSHVIQALTHLVETEHFRHNAGVIARRLAERSPSRVLDAITAHCLSFCG